MQFSKCLTEIHFRPPVAYGKNGPLTSINPAAMQLNDYKNYLYKAACCIKEK